MSACRHLAALLVLLLVGLGYGVLRPAWAQGRRIIFEVTAIVGKIQKPEILIFISRTNLNQDAPLVLRESFVPRIVKSVESKPF